MNLLDGLPSDGDAVEDVGYKRQGDVLTLAQIFGLVNSSGNVKRDAMDDIITLFEYMVDHWKARDELEISAATDATSQQEKEHTVGTGKIRHVIYIGAVNATRNSLTNVTVDPGATGTAKRIRPRANRTAGTDGDGMFFPEPLRLHAGSKIKSSLSSFTAGDTVHHFTLYKEETA